MARNRQCGQYFVRIVIFGHGLRLDTSSKANPDRYRFYHGLQFVIVSAFIIMMCSCNVCVVLHLILPHSTQQYGR